MYRPVAHLWECSQSGVQNNKIFFTEATFSFVLSSGLAAFPHSCKGSKISACLGMPNSQHLHATARGVVKFQAIDGFH